MLFFVLFHLQPQQLGLHLVFLLFVLAHNLFLLSFKGFFNLLTLKFLPWGTQGLLSLQFLLKFKYFFKQITLYYLKLVQ